MPAHSPEKDPERKPPGRLGAHPRSVTTALLFVSLAVSLLLAEVLVRSFSPVGPALLVTDRGVGKRFSPGFHGHVFVDEVGREVEVRINADGFPGPDWSPARPEGGLRIAVLGDSMTAAIATEERKRFVALLASALETSTDRHPVEVMNLGVSSASTASELVTWRAVASGYRPDLVLLAFFTGNDLADNSSRLTSAPRVYFDLDPRGQLIEGAAPAPTPPWVRWLDRHSRLYVWQKLATRRLRGRTRSTGGELEPGQRVFSAGADPDVEQAWAVTAALLRRLRDEVRGSGARLGLMVIPCADQVDDQFWDQLQVRAAVSGLRIDRDAPSRRLAAIARELEIPLLDLAPVFRDRARRASPERTSAARLYLMGRFHLADEGHQAIAEALHRFLLEGQGRPLLGI